MDRTAEEHRSTFYAADAAELCMSYVCNKSFLKKLARTSKSSTAVKKKIGYSTINGKFKCLEPHFQISATRSGWKDVTETAVASPHSRECTKEPISPLLNIGSMEKFGARAE